MNDVRKTAVVTFLAVFVVVVAAGAVLGFVVNDNSSSGSTDYVDIDNPQYDADRITSDRSPGQADIEMNSAVFDNEVVVHVGGAFTERDIAPLVNALVEGGHEVTVIADESQQVTDGPIVLSEESVNQVPPPSGEEESRLEGELDDAHGFISVGVNGYTEPDLEEISEFIEDNGRVVVAVDADQEFANGEGHTQTFSELDMYTEPGYVYNLAENDLNYQRIFAEPEGTSVLTDDVDRVVFDSATPVQAAVNADETMVPIDGTELSVTREETDKPVLVRDGDVALVGDTGFMTPENTQRADNDVFVANIAEFLVESNRVFDESSGDATQNDTDTETVTVEVGPDGEHRFAPEVVEIEPGTTVRFEWKSGGHNIVPVFQDPADAEWEGVEEIQDEGFIHEYTFEEEGVHEFVSEPHEDDMMYGVIVVGDP